MSYEVDLKYLKEVLNCFPKLPDCINFTLNQLRIFSSQCMAFEVFKSGIFNFYQIKRLKHWKNFYLLKIYPKPQYPSDKTYYILLTMIKDYPCSSRAEMVIREMTVFEDVEEVKNFLETVNQYLKNKIINNIKGKL